MSGGYFDRSTYAIREIADTMERDIARALQPKPEKEHMDYWVIYEKDSFSSFHATRVDWMMSGDDSEESFRERIKGDLAEFEKEYATKDWTYLDEDDE